jgi:hypothetical protein
MWHLDKNLIDIDLDEFEIDPPKQNKKAEKAYTDQYSKFNASSVSHNMDLNETGCKEDI